MAMFTPAGFNNNLPTSPLYFGGTTSSSAALFYSGKNLYLTNADGTLNTGTTFTVSSNNNNGIGLSSATLTLGKQAAIGFCSGAVAFDGTGTVDATLWRPTATTFQFGAANFDTSGVLVYGTGTIQTANAAQWIQGQASELLTIAAAASTDTTANLLPANSVIEAVVCRVVTVIPTAATFTIGDATTAARFATGVAVAATTTAVGLTHVDQTGAAGPKQTAAAKVRITPNLTPGTATGQVRITVFYRQFVAPTS